MDNGKDDGGLAFPKIDRSWNSFRTGETIYSSSGGMTLRDYFAAKAMHAALASPSPLIGKDDKPVEHVSEVAQVAYRIADAMLEARQA